MSHPPSMPSSPQNRYNAFYDAAMQDLRIFSRYYPDQADALVINYIRSISDDRKLAILFSVRPDDIEAFAAKAGIESVEAQGKGKGKGEGSGSERKEMKDKGKEVEATMQDVEKSGKETEKEGKA